MDQPLVVEVVVGEMDPGFIPGAVATLREGKRDLRLSQGHLVRLPDESPIEDEGGPSGINLLQWPDQGGDIPNQTEQSPDHHREPAIGRAEERDVDLRQPEIVGVVAELRKIHGLGVREDEREVVDELPCRGGKVLEDRLLGDAVLADRGENPGEGAGVTVRGNIEDVVEFFPSVPDPGERRVPGDPGEHESDNLLPAAQEGVLGGSGAGPRSPRPREWHSRTPECSEEGTGDAHPGSLWR